MYKTIAVIMALALMAAFIAGCAPAAPAPATGAAPAQGASDATGAADAANASNASGDSGEKVIKVGVFESLTGENGGGGLQEAMGIRFANEQFPTVTIAGETYKIQLVEADNKSDKTEAVTAAQSLISQGCKIILGSYGSGVSIAAGGIFQDAGVPAIGTSCTNPQVTLGNDYYFRVCFLDPFQGTVMANYAFQEGATKAAVITQLGDDYSSGLGNFFKNAFLKLAGEGSVVAEEQFQTNQTDFKALLTNIKATGAEVIFAPSSNATAPLIIKQARELGITAKLMAGDTWDNSSIIENAGADAEGVVISTFFDESDTSSEVAKAFIPGFKEYLTKNGQSDIIPSFCALGYDAYCTALAAMEASASAESKDIRDALAALSTEGVTGSISFDENGDAKKDMAFIKTIKDGQYTFLKTVTVAE